MNVTFEDPEMAIPLCPSYLSSKTLFGLFKNIYSFLKTLLSPFCTKVVLLLL